MVLDIGRLTRSNAAALPTDNSPSPPRFAFFLSHTKRDKPRVRRLVDALRGRQHRVWFDEDDIRYSQNIPQAVKEGIESSDVFVLVLSRAVLRETPEWPISEYSMAAALDKPKFVIWLGISEADVSDHRFFRFTTAERAFTLVKFAKSAMGNLIDELTRFHKANSRAGTEKAPDLVAIQEEFQRLSRVGAFEDVAIKGLRLDLPVTDEIESCLLPGCSLLEGGPGAGKTGVLLELLKRQPSETLFLKMDRLVEQMTFAEFEQLTTKIRLFSAQRPLRVLIDSLDVLSTHRQTKELRAALRLLDQIQPLPHVSTLVACREFDRKYDPALRNRTWTNIFHIPRLSYHEQVVPFLKKLGCDVTTIGVAHDILEVPQNLGLYVTLLEGGPVSAVASAPALYELYLQELVLKDPSLDRPAIAALEKLGEALLCRRGHQAPVGQFQAPEKVLRQLQSLNILLQPQPGFLGFAHQSWLEFMAIRSASTRGTTLLRFILDQVQLPFCRPFVRLYFQHQALNPNIITDVRAVLDSPAVYYHVKRLIVVSLAELPPPENAWPILTLLKDSHSELFGEFLKSYSSAGWLDLLESRWIERAWADEQQHGHVYFFLGQLRAFDQVQPERVIRLSVRGLETEWNYRGNFVFLWYSRLKGKILGAPNCRRLIELLLAANRRSGDLSIFADNLARWISLVDGGDDLLWSFLQKPHDETQRPLHRPSLNCGHGAFPEGFLAARLRRSDWLKDQVLRWLFEWEAGWRQTLGLKGLTTELLSYSSWRLSRRRGIDHHEALHELFVALESAFKLEALEESDWWHGNSEMLRRSTLEVLRYLHLIAITQEAAVKPMTAVLEIISDVDGMKQGGLLFEITNLVRMIYPDLSPAQREEHQDRILKEFDHEDPQEEMQIALIMRAIPACYRRDDGQELLERVERSAPLSQKPGLVSWGGWISAPFDDAQIMSLSNQGLLRLLDYYETKGYDPSHGESMNLIGGRDQILSVMRSVASRDPCRFFQFLKELGWERDAFRPILAGLGDHVGHASGQLQSSSNHEPQSALDVSEFFKYVLALPQEWRANHDVLHCLRWCAGHVGDEVLVSELIDSLPKPGLVSEPRPVGHDDHAFLQAAANCPLGVGAETALEVARSRARKRLQLGDSLNGYIESICLTGNAALHAVVLRYLPEIIWYLPETGWPLYEHCIDSAPKGLWMLVESCLYTNYAKHSTRVIEALSRLPFRSLAECGEAWGRIVALLVLSGKAETSALRDGVQSAPSASVWDGAAEVFATNLGRSDVHPECLAGLRWLLENSRDGLDRSKLQRTLFKKENHLRIDESLALKFLDCIQNQGETSPYSTDFYEWLEQHSSIDAASALRLIERLPDLAELRYQGGILARIFVALLMEVDARTDEEFTRRVLDAQDRFLRMNLPEFETLFQASSYTV